MDTKTQVRQSPPTRVIRVAYGIDSMAGTGGTELHAVRLAEQVRQYGVEPIMITLNGDGPMLARYRANGIAVHQFPVTSLIGGTALKQVAAMAKLLRKESIDVVHTHDIYTNFLLVAAARLAGVPLVVASKRWVAHLRSRHKMTSWVSHRLAHAITANSPAVAHTIFPAGSTDLRKVSVTPNFLDDEAFTVPTDVERAMLRQELGIGVDDTVFVILARLRQEKDHAFLLRAFARVAASSETARLMIIGDGPERDPLTTQISQLGLSSQVMMMGEQVRPRSLLSACDVAVLTSRHEGFPNALLEAMAVGLPVVATAVGGVVDAVSDGETGFLVPLDDELAFAEAMREVLVDRQRRVRMGAAARTRTNETFRAGTLVPQLTGWYRRRLDGAQR